MLQRLIPALLAAALPATPQGLYPLQRVDDLSTLALAYIHMEEAKITIDGGDDSGLPWQVLLDRHTGVGETTVYTGDFDADGRQDLLLTDFTFGSGRCIDGGDAVVLLFDDRGRPSIWSLPTHGFIPDPPYLFTDLNGDDQLEILAIDCEYADESNGAPPMTEVRTLSAVYEAHAGRWEPLPHSSLPPYLDLASRPFESEDYILWRLAEPGSAGPPDPVQVSAILSYGTMGQPFAPAVRYSDGTVRPGLPSVVFDAPTGLVADLRESAAYAGLSAAVDQQLLVRPLRPFAAPTVLVAHASAPETEPDLAARQLIESLTQTPIEVVAQRPAPIPSRGRRAVHSRRTAPPRVRWLARNGHCVQVRNLLSVAPVAITGCAGLGALQPLAETAGTFTYAGRERTATRIRPVEGVVETIEASTGKVVASRELDRPTILQGADLIGIAHDGLILWAHWRRGDQDWLTRHDHDGARFIPSASAIAIKGDLFTHSYDGLEFLRWQDGAPIERLTVAGRVEYTKAPN